jgi:hypothetical protein
MAANDWTISIVVALIPVTGTVAAAMISRPRPAPATTPEPSPGRQPAQMAAAGPNGAYGLVPGSAGWEDSDAPLRAVTAVRRLRISRSLWWGIAAAVSAAASSFALALGFGLVGIFLAVRDIRSPGTRRLVWWGLAVCVTAFVIAVANPHTGFMTGFSQGYDSTSH